jgi:hypothetical protein
MADFETELEMDGAQLCREDVFTDSRIGTIRRLTPVQRDGSPDPTRPVVFAGQTQILTSGGMLPLAFEIEAATLAEAVQKFGAAAKDALDETMREIEEMRRQAASQLVLPDAAAASSILTPGGSGKFRR